MNRDTLPLLLPSPSETWRAARNELARRANVQEVPKVVWAGLEEPADQYAARVAVIRRSWSGRILAAVPHGYAVPAGVQAVPFAPRMFWLLHPDTPSRYRAGSGGRGSGKSHGFAAAIVLRMLERRLRVLCAREIQRSLRESVHALLTDKIEALGLSAFFDVTDREITCSATGSEVLFAGLWANINTLKSLENIGLCWIEEGESVTDNSLSVLTPTIRAAGSEIWISLNPDAPEAPAMQFVDGERPDCRRVHVTFADNPWFPAELEGERLYLQSVDPDAYAHVWLGMTRTHSDSQVFRGKYTIEEFTPGLGWNGPYMGADWGFSQDPTTLVRCWIHERNLYVEHEAYGVAVDIDRTPQLFDTVPGSRGYTIRADCARPETISYMRGHTYPNVIACDKWKGCAEDGVAHLRSYEKIIVHPRCTHTAEEMRLYSFKVDKLSGDVMPDLVGKHDHCIDALRYALEPLIKRRNATQFVHSFHMSR
jgi:phage terminase large subunit